MKLVCTWIVAAALVLGGCSASRDGAAPSGGALPPAAMHPSDGAIGMPGDGATGMPGDGATGMPGGKLACDTHVQTGQADCTLAININVPPLSDATAPASMIPGLHPADLRSAYSLPSQRAGTTVAVIDAYDDPTAETDLAVYRAAFGLPACTTANGCLRKVNQQGQSYAYPSPDPAWAQEISLDLDVVSAVCPNCKILLVETQSANLDDLGAGIDRAVAMGARAVSNSYYAAEWSGESSEDVHYHHPGVAITVSSGDADYTYYPAASQYVTSVGGTTLSGTGGSWKEAAWPYDGRGCSKYVKRPSWQSAAPCKTRATVDVAADADPQTGVSMYDSASGGWLVAGGTSVGAPLVAAAYALGSPQGPAYSYARRSAFHDVPPSGYDLATGLGSPAGVAGL